MPNREKLLIVRVTNYSEDVVEKLRDLIENEDNAELEKEEEVDPQYKDFVIRRELNSVDDKFKNQTIKNEPGMKVLTQGDAEE